SASCAGARCTTVHVPGTAGRKIHNVGIPGSVKISLADRNLQEECAEHAMKRSFADLRIFGRLSLALRLFSSWTLPSRTRTTYLSSCSRLCEGKGSETQCGVWNISRTAK